MISSGDEMPRHLRGPCVVETSGERPKTYGPFVSVDEAIAWMNVQFGTYGSAFSIISLRTPFRDRKYEDWWCRDDLRKDHDLEADFPGEPWFEINPT